MRNKYIKDYIQYDHVIKAKRLMINRSANDFNSEPNYKLQKVRIYGLTKSKKSYVVDSYGNFKFSVPKQNIFLSKDDMLCKINDIHNLQLDNIDKKYIINNF